MKSIEETIAGRMKGIIFALLALLAIDTISIAQTHIPAGNVSGTWTLGNSPYYIDGEIAIPVGSTLTIEPGVSVEFQGHYKLIVNGFLEAVGTQSDPILFTAANTVEGWHGIRFINAPDSSQLSFCIIEYGRAMGGAPDDSGGGVFCDNSNPVISHCIIRENSADGSGGGIYFAHSSPTIRWNTILYNTAGMSLYGQGGGIAGLDVSTAIIERNLLRGNSAVLQNNPVWDVGGGGMAFDNKCNPYVINNTLDSNYTTYGKGGGILVDYNAHPIIKNNIISNCPDGEGIYVSFVGGARDVFYNDVWNNADGNFGGNISPDPSNISLDPLFADPENGDFRLTEYSPCIDAGDPTSPLDPDGTIADIGAFHYEGKIRLKWVFPTGDKVNSSPAIDLDGTIYVGSYNNNLYAINPDGTEKWAFPTGGDLYSAPAIGLDGTIYVGSKDSNLYAINPDGTEKWAFPTGGDLYSSPAIDLDGTIYVGSLDHSLYAINPDGTEKWAFPTGHRVYSSPAIGLDGTVYVGSQDSNLCAINPDGTKKWAFPTGSGVDSSPAIGSDGTIYVGSWDSNLYAINPDGTEKWTFPTGSGVNSSPAIGSDGTIYVGSYDHNLYAINPDGTKKWAFPTGDVASEHCSAAIGSDGTIYAGSYDHKLYAINPDGTEKWAFPTGHIVKSSPAIGLDATIYVGSNDGNFYAIEGDSGGLADTPWPMFHHDLRHTGSIQLPQIGVSPASLTFNATAGGVNPSPKTLSITNPGCDTLNWTAMDNATWLFLSPTSGSTTTETDEVTVSVDITGLTEGTYNANITIASTNASNSPQNVSVTLNLYTGHVLSISLYQGFNLFSIPFNLPNTDLSVVLADIFYSIDSVFALRGGLWYGAAPDHGTGTWDDQIGTIDGGETFVIYMLSDDTLSVVGTPLLQTAVVLNQGFNLAPYNCGSVKTVEEAFGGIRDYVDSIFVYDAVNHLWLGCTPNPAGGWDTQFDTLSPGIGIVIYCLTDGVVWDVGQ